jgi:hypothetical protein
MVELERLAINLLLYLQCVSAINENTRCLLADNSNAPGPAEACYPLQALGIGRNILTLEFVLTRNNEGVDFLPFEFRAQFCKSFGHH